MKEDQNLIYDILTTKTKFIFGLQTNAPRTTTRQNNKNLKFVLCS